MLQNLKQALHPLSSIKKWTGSAYPYIGLAIANIIWGATPVVAKYTLVEFPVGVLAFLRFFLAFVLLIPFLITARPKIKFDQKDWPILALTGVCIVTFHILFFFEGIKLTRAIDASVLTMLVPVLSVLGAWWWLKEKVYVVNIIGVLTGLVGALAIVGIPLLAVDALDIKVLIGNLLIVASNIFFVIGAIVSKKLLSHYSPLALVGAIFFIGALTFLPLAITETITRPWLHQVTIVGIFGVIFITLLSSISAFFLFEWSVLKLGVIKSDLFGYFQPAVAATLAVPLLGERISYTFIVGSCLVVLGVYWGTIGRKDHRHHHIRSAKG